MIDTLDQVYSALGLFEVNLQETFPAEESRKSRTVSYSDLDHPSTIDQLMRDVRSSVVQELKSHTTETIEGDLPDFFTLSSDYDLRLAYGSGVRELAVANALRNGFPMESIEAMDNVLNAHGVWCPHIGARLFAVQYEGSFITPDIEDLAFGPETRMIEIPTSVRLIPETVREFRIIQD